MGTVRGIDEMVIINCCFYICIYIYCIYIYTVYIYIYCIFYKIFFPQVLAMESFQRYFNVFLKRALEFWWPLTMPETSLPRPSLDDCCFTQVNQRSFTQTEQFQSKRCAHSALDRPTTNAQSAQRISKRHVEESAEAGSHPGTLLPLHPSDRSAQGRGLTENPDPAGRSFFKDPHG